MDRNSTATAQWFEQLGNRGHIPALNEANGTIRFDLRNEHEVAHWLVQIKDGNVQVSQEDRPADCIVHSDLTTYDQIVTGRLLPLPAWLRNLFWVEGDAVLVRIFNTVFPGPPNARHPRDLEPHPGWR